jgi:Tol biopolymer transport system component
VMGKMAMSNSGANKRKNDASSNKYSSFQMTFLVLLLCAACGFAALAYSLEQLSGRLPTSRLTYISSGVTYVLNLQTGDSISMGITQQDSFYAAPLSPDHRWIAQWERDVDQQSYVVIVDASNQQPVYRHRIDSTGSRLSWSTDSQSLVLSAQAPDDAPESMDLWVMQYATGMMQRLTHTPQLEIDATFSPDGTQIAYTTIENNGEHHLYVMDLETQQTHLLTSDENADRPSWSPDGRWIAFEASADGTTSHIELIRPDGRDRQAVTSPAIYAHTPIWIP